MSGEFDRCNFCKNNHGDDCDKTYCSIGEAFEMDSDKVITKAKECGISPSDVIMFIEYCN